MKSRMGEKKRVKRSQNKLKKKKEKSLLLVMKNRLLEQSSINALFIMYKTGSCYTIWCRLCLFKKFCLLKSFPSLGFFVLFYIYKDLDISILLTWLEVHLGLGYRWHQPNLVASTSIARYRQLQIVNPNLICLCF